MYFDLSNDTHQITNSTISGNSAGSYGGGLALELGNASFHIINSTISGNTNSGGNGGGAYISGGLVHINNSTITGNSAGSVPATVNFSGAAPAIVNSASGIWFKKSNVYLTNSILSNNGEDCYSEDSTIHTAGNNLVRTKSNCVAVGPAFIELNPILGPLADNGGPTLTHLPLDGSPVINAGGNSVIPVGLVTDQRGPGFFRIYDGTVDLGSVEVQPPAELIFGDSFE